MKKLWEINIDAGDMTEYAYIKAVFVSWLSDYKVFADGIEIEFPHHIDSVRIIDESEK